MAPSDFPVVLYHYTFSPYARRIVWYLTLRGIPYIQCLQPLIMPRPDVTQLGIAYRRIPLLSIGRDVYLDTRLILQTLEELFPASAAHPSLSASTSDQKAMERLLSHFIIDGGIFMRGSQLLPPDLPALKDPKFLKDRAELFGAPAGSPPMTPEAMLASRSEAISEIQNAMELLETTLLADGRDWLLKTEGPKLADIEAVWVFHWLKAMPGALTAEIVSAKQFPKVYAWIERFSAASEVRERVLGRPKTIKGDEAAELILNSAFAADEGEVDGGDAVVVSEGLKKGDVVRLGPTDTGVAHKELGKLLSLTSKEVVIETRTKSGTVRVHAPRHGFRVKKAEGNLKL
ncbi:glutathione S-transferase [Pseudomassariella vexata]|uniref:Glutathione S-transferase n=1 Tax=Pseudomassariella vexata TaxID=1141098 RepID=A0A1Y2E1U7_9PEZI|nr:glutathione S-transferase [Pseudomassariella vexata]ORY65427.1 glutathione S-transferase [Pseudomassariella vexata]